MTDRKPLLNSDGTPATIFGIPIYETEAFGDEIVLAPREPDFSRVIDRLKEDQQNIAGRCIWRNASDCARDMYRAGYALLPCCKPHWRDDWDENDSMR